VDFEDTLCEYRTLEEVPREVLFEAKQYGYSDAQLANLYLGNIKSETIIKVREHRKSLGIEPVYKMVDTCAAEFEAVTPYYYSTYESGSGQVAEWPSGEVNSPDDEIRITDKQKVIILGGGPNRIGQGIEFDYCCCHAAFAARDLGFESVMINSNPETVSTDYDTSDILFFEPLTLEDVMNVVERLNAGPLSQREPIGHYGWTTEPIIAKHSEEILRAIITKNLARAAIFNQSRWSNHNDSHAGRNYHLITDDGQLWEAKFESQPTASFKLEAVQGEYWRPEETEQPMRSARIALGLEKGRVLGLIVQFGGQTPLNLAHGLVQAGAPIIGTSVKSIDIAEDREQFDAILERLQIKRPPSGTARTIDEAVEIANRIGYPVLVRPSYVLGGRGMEVCSDEKTLRNYVTTALKLSGVDDAPVLIDRFLDAATEVDVDVVADFSSSLPTHHSSLSSSSSRAAICGVMEHIEHAGVHSGDSSCTIPPYSLPRPIQERIRTISRQLAEALSVRGLMNVQMAIKDGEVYILEVNPRASRTAPFVSKATHIPWPNLAARVMMGKSLDELGVEEVDGKLDSRGPFAVKESVFPFSKFPGVDVVLGPEMRSTGEVMGLDASFPVAFAKAQMAAGGELPRQGGVFMSVRESDRQAIIEPTRSLMAMGFKVYATEGTGEFLRKHGMDPVILQKIAAGARPNVIDLMTNGEISLVINTPTRTGWQTDEGKIRSTAVRLGVPMITTATAAAASVKAIEAVRAEDWDVAALQDYTAPGKKTKRPEPVVVTNPVTAAKR
jgi:carbamoylphosphate synthase large subunit